MRDLAHQSGRLVGYVQIQVGSKTISLPVQAVRFKGEDQPGEGFGLFEDKGKLGILVDDDATPRDVQDQIARASQEAVKKLSRVYLN